MSMSLEQLDGTELAIVNQPAQKLGDDHLIRSKWVVWQRAAANPQHLGEFLFMADRKEVAVAWAKGRQSLSGQPVVELS